MSIPFVGRTAVADMLVSCDAVVVGRGRAPSRIATGAPRRPRTPRAVADAMALGQTRRDCDPCAAKRNGRRSRMWVVGRDEHLGIAPAGLGGKANGPGRTAAADRVGSGNRGGSSRDDESGLVGKHDEL